MGIDAPPSCNRDHHERLQVEEGVNRARKDTPRGLPEELDLLDERFVLAREDAVGPEVEDGLRR
eukprot:8393789-Heterocapsa_arctica.AAC.1